MMITAKCKLEANEHISQCDLFRNIKIIESVDKKFSELTVQEIEFPYVIVLNQECDLCRDFENRESENECAPPKDTSLLHLIVAPVFNFDAFLAGSHWGSLFGTGKSQKRKDTIVKEIMQNEIPRYHYLRFEEQNRMPEMIIDFKHFFTVNSDYMYNNIDHRVYSLDALFKEKISQRFAYYLSRIGLPDQ